MQSAKTSAVVYLSAREVKGIFINAPLTNELGNSDVLVEVALWNLELFPRWVRFAFQE